MAGQAAVMRLTPEEQEVEDCCGHTKGNGNAASTATAAAAAAVTPAVVADRVEAGAAAAAAAPGSPGSLEDASLTTGSSSAQGVGVAAAAAAAAVVTEEQPFEAEVSSLVSDMSVTSEDMAGDDGGIVSLSRTSAAAEAAAAAIGGGSSGSGSDSGSNSTGEREEKESGEEERQQQGLTTTPGGADEMDVVTEESAPATSSLSSPPPPTPLSPLAAAEDSVVLPPPPSQPFAPLDELLAMGFPREAAMEALAASGGSIPDAAYRLLTPGMMPSNGTGSSADAAATVEQDAGTSYQVSGGSGANGDSGDIGGGGGGGGRLPRDVRLQQAVDRIAGHGDPARAVQVTVFGTDAERGGAVINAFPDVVSPLTTHTCFEKGAPFMCMPPGNKPSPTHLGGHFFVFCDVLCMLLCRNIVFFMSYM